MMRTLTLYLVTALLAAACSDSGDPAGPDPPGPGDGSGRGSIAIAWDGVTVDWGAPESLRATSTGGFPEAIVVWRSLDDLYLGRPVVLGMGAAVATSALKPGTTTVEATLVAGGATVASDTIQVEVGYRRSWNVALESMVAYPAGTVGDVWVTGELALVARRAAGGISIVDLRGPAREIGRFTRPGLFTQDIKASDSLAFVSHEGQTYPSSVTILDLADPAAPREVAAIPRTKTPTAHNLWLDAGVLYVAAPSGTRAIHAYDVTDPASPRPLARLSSTNGSAHDMHVRSGVVYGSYLPLRAGEIGELVVASAPGLGPLSFTSWPGAFTHSSWLAANGRTLYVADELVNAPIRIYDVSSPGSPLLVGTYQPRLGTIPHNFQVNGTTAYLAHYKHGVEVVDVSDPRKPRLVGFYDTLEGPQADVGTGGPGNPGATSLTLAHEGHEGKGQGVYQGAWGVHWTGDGRIVVSDMNSGLFVLRFTGASF